TPVASSARPLAQASRARAGISGQGSSTARPPRRSLVGPTANAIPTRRERGRVEALSGGECQICAFRRLAPKDPAQHPFAREPDEVERFVGRTELALRMEVEVERRLLDERRIG